MLFTEPIFLPFFGAVFVVAWLETSLGRRKLWLLLASYVFYGAWDWRFLGLIGLATLIDYGIALAIVASHKPAQRRFWLVATLVSNLGILGFFKYFNFFVQSGADLLRLLGLPVADRALAIVLPVGISFFTFQSMSYTIDVYRGNLRAVRSLLDFALFVAFFPQLVAGPIVRAAEFLPQLDRRPRLAQVDFRRCLMLFLLGFIKKTCIADRLAREIDPVFASPQLYDAAAVWLAVLSYAVQIYCDFSGYTDMAIGSAGLLGYHFRGNFDFPYLARNIADFWRRWHISLSSWLRDYLYIPLGGNRISRLTTYRNILLTMFLGGLWHGAAWTFVVWGALHGLALVAHRLWLRWRPGRLALPSGLGRWLGLGATFYFVCCCWIFFRAPDFRAAAVLADAFVFLASPGSRGLDPTVALALPALAAAHWLAARGVLERASRRAPTWAFASVYGAAAALALAFVPMQNTPFIYFQF
jgi:alginate O-acetyltransferase complex protein AlgI